MTKFFQIIDTNKIVASAGNKVIPQEEFALLVTGQELIEQIHIEQQALQKKYEELTQKLYESGEEKGFQKGLENWNVQLAQLDKHIHEVREELAKGIAPVALAAVKKIIGREVEQKPDTVIDIVRSSLKAIAQHQRITLYVNKGDLSTFEQEKGRLKEVFDRLESLAIVPREDILPGACKIESEAGIINANLDKQFSALEVAFKEFFDQGGLEQ